MLFRGLGLAACSSLLLACSGGSSPETPSITKTEAYRFLNQATFGATESEAKELMAIGYQEWIERQMELPPTPHEPSLSALPHPTLTALRQRERIDIWFQNSVRAPTSCASEWHGRCRRSWSCRKSRSNSVRPRGLLRHARAQRIRRFSPADPGSHAAPDDGHVPPMLGNRKPGRAKHRPDENYARELMQLFTVGLVELNPDGTLKLDAHNQSIPTYSRRPSKGSPTCSRDGSGRARERFNNTSATSANQILPMQLFPDQHDRGAKRCSRRR